jgi:hypothetical protein
LIGFANRPELGRRLVELGVSPSRYEGPTGIVGALHDACRRQAMASASLWAAAPHYLASTTNPKAAVALLQCLSDFLELGMDLGQMKRAAARFEAQVEEALAANPELAAYLQQLEERLDTAGEPEPRTLVDGPELPPGEAVVEELEKFLREKRQEGDDEQASCASLVLRQAQGRAECSWSPPAARITRWGLPADKRRVGGGPRRRIFIH